MFIIFHFPLRMSSPSSCCFFFGFSILSPRLWVFWSSFFCMECCWIPLLHFQVIYIQYHNNFCWVSLIFSIYLKLFCVHFHCSLDTCFKLLAVFYVCFLSFSLYFWGSLTCLPCWPGIYFTLNSDFGVLGL